MNVISRILFKVLVKEFYRINAGFFLIAVGICFGFLRDIEHIALARYFTSSPYTLAIPIGAWFLYSIKIAAFNDLSMEKKENEFLYAVAAINPSRLWSRLLLITAQQFLPALLYGMFLVAMAVQVRQPGVILIILTALIFFIAMMAGILYRKINHPNTGIRINFLRRKFNKRWTRPYVGIYPEWIAKRQPLLVIGSKVFACLMILGISRLYQFDTYDDRLWGMGCALVFSFNLVIVYYYHRFENSHFQLLRGLPIPLNERLAYFIATWMILSLPEIGAIINYFPEGLSPMHLFTTVAFGISTGLLSYSSLFMKDITLETFLQKVFIATFLWIILVLFKVPLAVLALLHIGAALLIYRKYYYSFEFNAEVNSEK